MNKKLKGIRQILLAIVVIAAITGISSCEKYSFTPPVINTTDTLHFSTDIQPIFTANCITCHGAIQHPILKEGKAYQNLFDGGLINLPGETSILYVHMNSTGHTARSSDAEKLKVLIWVNQGALNN